MTQKQSTIKEEEGILKRLKADTRELHDEVEAAMNSGRVMSDDFSKDEYGRLLQKLLLAHSSLEPLLLANDDIRNNKKLDAGMRLSKSYALAEDLKKLDLAGLTIHIDLPELQSGPESWGALYVLEGSTLGGSIIHSHLKKKGIVSTEALSFYGRYGADTGKLWKEFKAALEEIINDDGATYQQVLKGARSAYALYISASKAIDDQL